MLRSVRGRLTAILVAVPILALLLSFAVATVRDSSLFQRELEARATLAAALVAESSARSVASGDGAAARAGLQTLAAVPGLEHARLVDRQGRTVAAFGRDLVVPRLEPELRSARFDGRILHVVEPLHWRGDACGALYLRLDGRGFGSRTLHRAFVLLLLLALTTAAAVAASWWLQRFLLQPIHQLATTAERIAETGNHSIRMQTSGGAELSALAQSFNGMLDQIQLRQLERDETVHRSREKSQFLAAMSHELRTPLNSIIGFSEILITRLESNIDRKLTSFLVNINSSGKHLLGLINDILDLAKVEAGKMALAPEPTSIQRLLEGVVALMRGTAGRRSIEIQIEVDGELPVIQADPVKLKQVFFNLIANAVKFSPERSQVQVVARQLGAEASPLGVDGVEIDFIDHGIGIAEKDFEKIFQPFRQADSGISRRFGGTGLGLSLVRSYVNKHHGIIELESAVGEGSTFRIHLPLRLGAAYEDTPVKARVRGANSRTTVVVLQRDGQLLESLRSRQRDSMLNLVAADDGEQALELMRHLHATALVLERDPSHEEGCKALLTVKSSPLSAGVPLVICCGSSAGGRETLAGLDADDLFFPSADRADVAARVNQLLYAGLGRRGPAPQVLVVTDDASCHDCLETRLVPLGFRLAHFESSVDALAATAADPPDLMILDLSIDHMAGFEMALELRLIAATAETPLILLGCGGLDREQRQQLRGRIDAFIKRSGAATPTPSEALERLLKRHLAPE